MLHLIMAGAPPQSCKGYILYEFISSKKFLENLKFKLLDPCTAIAIPKIDFKIPAEYFELSEALK